MGNGMKSERKIKKFGTMAGVFTPTFLTILGVIMFIRHPWVVGNSGVLGSILIVVVSVAITLSTALSLSSITTNIRIGSGGAFSLISQSLGLEIGGAIGIPFYFSQAIAVAMYVFGFREGLQTILPEFSPLILDVENYNVFIDKAFYSPIVLAGLLGATLSSALGSFVGAPRILLALGEKRILPKSRFLAKTNKKGEPFNAMLVTSLVVVLGLSFRNLNTVAPLITMFFMITYAMVNVVALIEQSLALPSYRPTLKIPLIVPILGTFGSLTVMFIINAAVALTSLVLIVVFYFYLAKKRLKSDAGDSRSGLFTALAGWSTKKTNELSPTREVRSWRPDLLIPVTAPKEIRSCFKLIEDIVAPKGSIKFLAVKSMDTDYKDRLINFLPGVARRLKKRGIATRHTYVDGVDFAETRTLACKR